MSRQLLLKVVKLRRFLSVVTLLCVVAGVGCSDQSQTPQTVVADWSSPAGARSVSPNLSLDLEGRANLKLDESQRRFSCFRVFTLG